MARSLERKLLIDKLDPLFQQRLVVVIVVPPYTVDRHPPGHVQRQVQDRARLPGRITRLLEDLQPQRVGRLAVMLHDRLHAIHQFWIGARHHDHFQRRQKWPIEIYAQAVRDKRSEEHTSELQSLMRTSYAVFCVKKKQYQQTKRPSRRYPYRIHKQKMNYTNR